jgi:Transcriptional regulator, AbiEi antitoxin
MESDVALDRRIAAHAAKQHGHITRKQLLEFGLGEQAIYYRLRLGRLHRVHPGVYGVGHRRRAPIDLAAAAVLACGKGAVLSDFSAAALWGFVKRWPEQPEVTVVRERRPAGIRVHRRQGLPRKEKTRQLGIPVTTPARTVLDCARRLNGQSLTRLVNDALLSLFLHRSELIEAIERHPKHPGSARVGPLLRVKGGPTKSELEDRFVAFCERHDLPRPEINVCIDGREVDAFFRAELVIVEIDSYEFHSDRATFERDRDKDADATAKGLITVRLTNERMTDTPREEAARLRRILAARRNG